MRGIWLVTLALLNADSKNRPLAYVSIDDDFCNLIVNRPHNLIPRAAGIYRSHLTLPKCLLLCEVDYESMSSFSIFRCSLFLVILHSIIPLVVVMTVVLVFLGRPRNLLPSILPSVICSCDELCLIRWPRYCNFLVLNCLTIYPPVPILLNTSSLVVFSVHDVVNSLRYIDITKASRLDNSDFIIVHVSAP